jgi:hypothetical protein
MSGFSFRQQIDGTNSYALLEIAAANSIVVQKGDLIRIANDGFGALLTAGDLVLGIVEGVVDANGLPVDTDSGTTDTWTMASDNETVALKKIQYVPALQQYLFFNDADSSLSRTLLFTYMNVNDENDVDPGSTSDSTLSTVRLIKIDPDGDGDASKGLFQIVESFWAQNCMGTVDTGGIEA